MSSIKSDRGLVIRVERESDRAWAQRHTSINQELDDRVVIDSHDHDAVIELTPVEARHLSAALLEYAERIETDPTSGRRSA